MLSPGSTGVPDRFTKIRIGFKMADGERTVVWFEPRGNDLYWGSGKPGRFGGSRPVDGETIEITVPVDFDSYPKVETKFSYHESGQVHHKVDGTIVNQPGQLLRPGEITEPTLIAALITMRADRYPVTGSLTRRGAHALGIQLDQGAALRRNYFEFLLTPPGRFEMPPMLLVSAEVLPPPVYTASVSPSTVLLVRHVVCGEAISDWQPDVEIWLHRCGMGGDVTAG